MKKTLSAIGLALLFFVAWFAAECLGFVSPFCWLYFGLIAAVLAAWPYAILCKKHPVFGMALLAFGVWFLAYIAMGEMNPATNPSGFWISIGLAVVAEILRRACGGYRSRSSVRASYLALSLVPVAKTSVMFFRPEYCHQVTIEEMGEQYAEKLFALTTPGIAIGVDIAILIVAFLCISFFTRDLK